MRSLVFIEVDAGASVQEVEMVSDAFAEHWKNRWHIRTNVWPRILVSTTFLAIDHSFGGGPPVLYETMIFGGKYSQDEWRYTSRAEAIKGHVRAVKIACEFGSRVSSLRSMPKDFLQWMMKVMARRTGKRKVTRVHSKTPGAA